MVLVGKDFLTTILWGGGGQKLRDFIYGRPLSNKNNISSFGMNPEVTSTPTDVIYGRVQTLLCEEKVLIFLSLQDRITGRPVWQTEGRPSPESLRK